MTGPALATVAASTLACVADAMERGRVARLAPGLLLATLLLMTAVATYAAASRVHERERDELTDEAHATVAAIDRRMEDYGQVLRGAAGLYSASEDVTYREFHDFFADQDVLRRFPGVQVIGFASYVPRAGIPSYTRRVRRATAASGLPYGAFRLHPPLRPDATEALIIDHVEPPAGNTEALGLDFLSEVNRRRAALLARRTGVPTASAPISLVQARGSSLAIDLMVPVFGGPPSQTGAPRLWAGVVYAAFRVDNLLRGILGAQMAGVDLEVYDLGPSATVPAGAPVGPKAVAFDLRPGRADRRPGGDDTRVETIEVAGRRWAVAYARSSPALAASERAVPWVIGIAGILVSLLAAGLLRALATSGRRAVRLAEAMTVELRERELELQRSNEELEHFAYLASHDLQEPLRTITSYVGLLEQRAGEHLDDRQRSWLGFVSDAAGRMSHLISDLLEYSRTGRAGDDTHAIDLDDAWDLAVANLQHAIADAGATVARGELPTVRARPREMTSMLQNLIANGLKYRGESPPVIRATARRHGDDRWEIAVADNGIGIDPRFHDRVFGLFQRLHATEEYPGTGMGLAIVKKIVESNGGTVRVESTPGQGATFVVTLPGAPEA
jgi:signal transduction histidine kinase